MVPFIIILKHFFSHCFCVAKILTQFQTDRSNHRSIYSSVRKVNSDKRVSLPPCLGKIQGHFWNRVCVMVPKKKDVKDPSTL